jgi:hypothetical protein
MTKYSAQAIKIAQELSRMVRPRFTPVKGLPQPRSNDDGEDDGTYRHEGLSEPPIQNMVTGSGGGPVIGAVGYARASSPTGGQC